MIALFVLAILYEGLKVGREILKRNASKPLIIRETYDLNGDTGKKVPGIMTVVKSPRYNIEFFFCSVALLFQTFLEVSVWQARSQAFCIQAFNQNITKTSKAKERVSVKNGYEKIID